MKAKLISTARLILLLVGAVILTLLVLFLFRGVVRTAGAVVFLIYVALSVYAIAVLPLVFTFQVDDGMVIGSVIYYRGVAIFAVLSAVIFLIALLAKRVTPLIIVLEVAAIFVLFLYLLVSYRLASNTMKVQKNEAQKKAGLDELKAQAALLRQKAGVLGDEAAPARERLLKLTESVRYLSPSDRPEAAALEAQLRDMIMAVDPSDVSPQCLQDMELLYQQRKGL
ncbi:MAG: hypothetical protein IKH56_00630 [Oscillospiraceae bacterium]|nr:hypothetical protein [Oscillospiraceae bacterium]